MSSADLQPGGTSNEPTKINTDLLNKASIAFEYLHTNSTTHEFLFGALAELVDNSRDAGANDLHIDYDDKSGMLSFLDDGCGMSRDEVLSIVSFGHSMKRNNPSMVGAYGNGLKSGSMRVAKDFILFTKKNKIMTCLFLSRSFHELNKLKSVFVPTPSFQSTGECYVDDRSDQDRTRHSVEVDIIYKYSPFRNCDEFMSQFKKIEGASGTLVVLYNLRRVGLETLEMDFTSDDKDVRMSNNTDQREEEKNSLRAYLSILYAQPHMKIFLRGDKVNTVHILNSLARPRVYRYSARSLKGCAKRAHDLAVATTKQMEDRVLMAKSDLNQYLKERQSQVNEKEVRMRTSLLRVKVEDLQEEVRKARDREKEAQKAKQNPQPLSLYFGLNIHHRNRYGMMVYNNGRLIDMYVTLNCQKEQNDKGMKCLGVIGYVDVSYSVLAPTHNKQGFENRNEYQSLLRASSEHMEQYWNDVQLIATPGGVEGFWRPYGYNSCEWKSVCNNNPTELMKRHQTTGYTVQCDLCLKWRHLDFQKKYLEKKIPDNWVCAMHPNAVFQSCLKKEELPRIKEGKLTPKESFTSTPRISDTTPKYVKKEVEQIEEPVRPRRSAPVAIPPPPPQPTRKPAARSSRSNDTQTSSEDEDEDYEEVAPKRMAAKRAPPPPSARSAVSSSSRAPPQPSPSRFRIPPKPAPSAKRPAPTPRRSRVDSEEDDVSEELPTKQPRTSITDTSKTVSSSVVEDASEAASPQPNDRELSMAKEKYDKAMKMIRSMLGGLAKHGSDKESDVLKHATDEKLLTVDMDQHMKSFCTAKVTDVLRLKDEKHTATVQKMKEEKESRLNDLRREVNELRAKNEVGELSTTVKAAAIRLVRWGAQGDPSFANINLSNALDRMVEFANTIETPDGDVGE